MSASVDELETIANALSERLAAITSELSLLTDHVITLIRDVHYRSTGVVRADLTQLSGFLRGALRDSAAMMDGIGIATATGYLQDSEHWLEWWRRGPRGRVEFVVHSLNPEQDVFYDYESRPWFASPISERRTIVTGPYVDMGGTNTYTLTIAVPIEVAGRIVGVAGADVIASRFERYLVRGQHAAPLPLPRVLTNGAGRVIASTSAEHPPGTLFAGTTGDIAAETVVAHHAPLETPWRLLQLR